MSILFYYKFLTDIVQQPSSTDSLSIAPDKTGHLNKRFEEASMEYKTSNNPFRLNLDPFQGTSQMQDPPDWVSGTGYLSKPGSLVGSEALDQSATIFGDFFETYDISDWNTGVFNMQNAAFETI